MSIVKLNALLYKRSPYKQKIASNRASVCVATIFSIAMCFEVKQYQLQMWEYSWNNNNNKNGDINDIVVMSRKIESSALAPCAVCSISFSFYFEWFGSFYPALWFFSLWNTISMFSLVFRNICASLSVLSVAGLLLFLLDFCSFHARNISDSNSSHVHRMANLLLFFVLFCPDVFVVVLVIHVAVVLFFCCTSHITGRHIFQIVIWIHMNYTRHWKNSWKLKRICNGYTMQIYFVSCH